MLARQNLYFWLLLATLGCCLLSPNSAYSAASDPGLRLVMAEEINHARTLLKEGSAEEAWKILRALLRENPDNNEVNALLVEASFTTGRDNQALAGLERLAELNPANASLQLALAKAYARAGDEAASAIAMEEALRLDPAVADANTQEDIEKAARASAKRYDRFLATGRFALGVIWDSNASCGLDNLDITIGEYDFHLEEDAEKKPAFGEYLNGNLNWSWRLGEDSNWHLAGDIAAYGKTYNRDLPSNRSSGWGRATIGLREISGKHMSDVRGLINNASYQPYESATGVGGEATWSYQFLPGFDFIARGGAESRSYMEYDGKDGLYWNAGIYGRLHFCESQHTLLAGIKAIGAQTDEDRYTYDGFEAIARLDLALMRKLTVFPFVAYRYSAYHAPSTRLSENFGEENRIDNMALVGVGATWNWTEHIDTEVGWHISRIFPRPLFTGMINTRSI